MELTYREPALKVDDGVNSEDGELRLQAMADESREAERTRLLEGDTTARTYETACQKASFLPPSGKPRTSDECASNVAESL
jgi:hypothetical protein